MNMMIAFFVGCLTFVIIMFAKIPVKKLIASLIKAKWEEEYSKIIYKRWNSIIFVLVMFVAVTAYCLVLAAIGEDHFKLCCTMKAAAIAIALYAVFEQWFGDDFRL